MDGLPAEVANHIIEFASPHRDQFAASLARIPATAAVLFMRGIHDAWTPNDFGSTDIAPFLRCVIPADEAEFWVTCLARCRCCRRHRRRRPARLARVPHRSWRAGGDDVCPCVCRHASRWLCRAFAMSEWDGT